MIPKEVLEDIQERVSLPDLVSQYIHLKKHGKNLVGLCPFHQERTPSFTINPEKQLFYCFGCKEGGNIFSFLMKKENVSFNEAVKILAKQLNIKIPMKKEKWDILYEVNEKASLFYQELLFKEEGKFALSYLMERGLKKETIEEFKLGYAPSAWERLKNYLGRLYSEDILISSGLLQKGKEESYDWVRNRIIFPIIDRFNRVLGFGARSLDETLPKYINTKETPIYNKSYILYALNLALPYIKEKKEVILTEGYMDVIMCHQYGFKNVVGVCGTSLTLGQISLLRPAENVIISFDPDFAGEKATEKGISLLLKENFNIFAISLNGSDPAELLKENGADAFSSLLLNKKPFFEFLIALAKNKEKEEAIRYLIPFIEMVSDPIKKYLFIKRVSEELFIREEVIIASLKNKYIALEDIPKKMNTLHSPERLLLSTILQDEEIAVWAIKELDKNLLNDDVVKEVFTAIEELIYSNSLYRPENLINYLSPSASSLISSLSMEEHTKDERFKLALSCIKIIKERALKEKMLTISKKIKEYEKNNEDIKELLYSYQELAKEVRKLK